MCPASAGGSDVGWPDTTAGIRKVRIFSFMNNGESAAPLRPRSSPPSSTNQRYLHIRLYRYRTESSSAGYTEKTTRNRLASPRKVSTGMIVTEFDAMEELERTSTLTRLALLSCSFKNHGTCGGSFNCASRSFSFWMSLVVADGFGGSPLPADTDQKNIMNTVDRYINERKKRVDTHVYYT